MRYPQRASASNDVPVSSATSAMSESATSPSAGSAAAGPVVALVASRRRLPRAADRARARSSVKAGLLSMASSS